MSDPRGNRSLTRSLLIMTAGSFVFGFALVPLYKVICEAAGIRVNDAPVAAHASEAGAGRRVTLEFISIRGAAKEPKQTLGGHECPLCHNFGGAILGITCDRVSWHEQQKNRSGGSQCSSGIRQIDHARLDGG